MGSVHDSGFVNNYYFIRFSFIFATLLTRPLESVALLHKLSVLNQCIWKLIEIDRGSMGVRLEWCCSAVDPTVQPRPASVCLCRLGAGGTEIEQRLAIWWGSKLATVACNPNLMGSTHCGLSKSRVSVTVWGLMGAVPPQPSCVGNINRPPPLY